MVTPDDRTAGVLTTQKLQSMIDAGLCSTVRSRRSLARVLTDSGQKISVHGVEGWFKNLDSNYAIPRESLDPGDKSYPIPKRRWTPILSIFDIDAEQLNRSDQEFRTHCFELVKRRRPATRESQAPASSLPLVFVVYAQEDSDYLLDEFRWLRDTGFSLWLDNSVCDGSEWSPSVATAIERASVCLTYLSHNLQASDRCLKELQLAQEYNVRVIASTAMSAVSDANVNALTKVKYEKYVSRSPTYRLDLASSLREICDTSQCPNGRSPLNHRAEMAGRRIAVIPFANLSGQQDVSHVAQGVTEDLNTLLARIPDLHVISRVASHSYSGMLVDYKQLHASLGVDYVVEGNIRPAPGGLRLNVSLTDVQTGVHRWSDQFNGAFEAVFTAQDEIVTAVTKVLEISLPGKSLAYGARACEADTWRYCNLGWFKSFVEPHMPALKEALECFYTALKIEPDYALAHAGVANALGTGMIWGGVGPSESSTLEKHALRAYELLPDHPAVLYAMGMREFVTTNPMERALLWVEQAVRKEPSNPAYLAAKAYLLAHTSRIHEALAVAEIVCAVSAGDLRQPFFNYMVSNVHICAGEYETGASTMLECDGLQRIDFVWFMVGYCRFCVGRNAEAEDAVKHLVAMTRRSCNFFTFSLLKRLWPQHDEKQKLAYLAFCQSIGLR